MREAADRLQAAISDNELTVSQVVRYETAAYLGAALYSLGLPAEALAAFEAAYQFSPTPVPSDDLMMNLANAYLASGRRDAAREALRFLLFHTPGHVAANMLLSRLDNAPDDTEVKGAVLGASPETIRSYIQTLTFTQSPSGGYEPAQVHEALNQLERFIGDLSLELEQAAAKIDQFELELLRYRQMEDAVVENMMQFQQNNTPSQTAESSNGEGPKSGLSPIEILFQQKT